MAMKQIFLGCTITDKCPNISFIRAFYLTELCLEMFNYLSGDFFSREIEKHRGKISLMKYIPFYQR